MTKMPSRTVTTELHAGCTHVCPARLFTCPFTAGRGTRFGPMARLIPSDPSPAAAPDRFTDWISPRQRSVGPYRAAQYFTNSKTAEHHGPRRLLGWSITVRRTLPSHPSHRLLAASLRSAQMSPALYACEPTRVVEVHP